VVDERLVQLLHDCNVYLARQRMLLLRAAVLGFPEDTVAMDAALDQLAAGVASARDATLTDPVDPAKRHIRESSDPLPGDPGE